MKSSKRALTTLISVLISLTVTGTSVGVGTSNLFSSLEDHTDDTNQQIIEENVSLESAITYHVVEATENVANTGKIELKLNEYEMNRILYAISQEIKIPDVKIRSIYVEFMSDKYKVFVPITVKDIETLISCDLSLNEIDHVISLELSNIHIGRLHEVSINTMLKLIEGTLKKTLTEYFVTIQIKKGTVTASISRENLKNVIDNMTVEDPLHNIILVAYNVLMLQSDAVKLNVSNPNCFSIEVDLKYFGGYKSTRFESFSTYISTYISKGIVNKENIDLVSKYYIKGYDRLEGQDRVEIESIFSNEIATDSIRSYVGFYGPKIDGDKIDDEIKSRLLESFIDGLCTTMSDIPWYVKYFIPNFSKWADNIRNYIDTTPLFSIHETTLQKKIDSFDLAGFVIPLTNDIDNNVSYIILDSISIRIKSGQIYINIGIDVNGYVIPLTLKLGIVNGSYLDALKIYISSAYLGNIYISNNDIDLIYQYVSKNVTIEGIKFSCDNLIIANVQTLFRLSGFLDTSKKPLLQKVFIPVIYTALPSAYAYCKQDGYLGFRLDGGKLTEIIIDELKDSWTSLF